MPIYEYQCQHCKHQFEAIRKISDEPLKVCPSCGRATLKKLVSKAAFRLKGGGWYETDFKSKGKKNVASGDGEPKTESPTDKKDGAKKSSSESTGDTAAKSAEKSAKKEGDGAKGASKGSKAKSPE